MIKVLHVTGAMNRGGAEVMLMDIFRNISPQFQFDFLVNYNLKSGISEADFDAEILNSHSTIKYIPAQWDIGPINYIKAFKKVLLELGKPDIVHIHLNAKSGVIALAAKQAGVKNIIVHSHANLQFRGSLISRILSTIELKFQKVLIARYANYFWGCSNEANLSLFYSNLLTTDRSAIINNAVDVNSYQNVSDKDVNFLRKSYNLEENTIVFGNIGRVVQHKNVLFLIDLFNDLNTKKIDFRFVFAGRAEQPDYLEEIFTKSDEYQIRDKIIYLDVRDDVPTVMSSFDVFIAPALKEGFGLVAVEAQAAGLPCILYKGFPPSVDMGMGLVQFLNTFEIPSWNEAIAAIPRKNTNKDEIFNSIATKGFDIKSNVIEIEDRYQKMSNHIADEKKY